MKKMLCEDTDWLLSEEAFSIYASCMYHLTYNDYVGLMEDYLSDTSKKVFVYEDRGKKTGLMVLKISEDAAEIIGIAVSDNARRKGIGTQLIQRVMESEDLKSVKAQTDDDSIGFYRKCGFSDERIVIEYPDGAAVRYNCVSSVRYHCNKPWFLPAERLLFTAGKPIHRSTGSKMRRHGRGWRSLPRLYNLYQTHDIPPPQDKAYCRSYQGKLSFCRLPCLAQI